MTGRCWRYDLQPLSTLAALDDDKRGEGKVGLERRVHVVAPGRVKLWPWRIISPWLCSVLRRKWSVSRQWHLSVLDTLHCSGMLPHNTWHHSVKESPGKLESLRWNLNHDSDHFYLCKISKFKYLLHFQFKSTSIERHSWPTSKTETDIILQSNAFVQQCLYWG